METLRFPVDERRHSRIIQRPLAVPRSGIMLHYDDSSRDDWAVEWFSDPRGTNGYTWLVLDDGRVIELADPGMRTPHAGPCLTRNANSCYYGIAAATNGQVLATEAQLSSIAALGAEIVRHHGWAFESDADRAARVVGHDAQAVWTAAYTTRLELWGRTGRKVDPTGRRADRRAIISLPEVRTRMADSLQGAGQS
jgi:N-acetyl-anhydromuramyl-L-alanine amidase AmpD